MIDISRLSIHYHTRILVHSDVDKILEVCKQNTLFYEFTEARPTRKQILDDMKLTPPGIELSAKYFFGFFEDQDLVAVMDLIDGYPKPEIVYIGFFMMNRRYQGKHIGSAIIGETADYLKSIGKTAIRLAIDKGNPQSAHFWKKNGFEVISKADVNGWTKLVAERSFDSKCREVCAEEEYKPQTASVGEMKQHGTAELQTERLVLRRYRPEDAAALYQYLGTDPSTVQYSGWNPYATPKMAQETVQQFIAGYSELHSYSWVIEADNDLSGTIGAYDYKENRIEVGFCMTKACRGRGYATEALKAVLSYLTENEGISCVTAWCASQNIGSRRVLEKAGMQFVHTEKDSLVVGDKTYDKQIYEYRMNRPE